MQVDISKALNVLAPTAIWRMEGEAYENIVWMCDEPVPTKEAIEAEIVRAKTEFEDTQYQRDRAQAYPSIEAQLDTLYHGGYDAWKAQIQAVKERFPK
jgi:hypothetical protein